MWTMVLRAWLWMQFDLSHGTHVKQFFINNYKLVNISVLMNCFAGQFLLFSNLFNKFYQLIIINECHKMLFVAPNTRHYGQIGFFKYCHSIVLSCLTSIYWKRLFSNTYTQINVYSNSFFMIYCALNTMLSHTFLIFSGCCFS